MFICSLTYLIKHISPLQKQLKRIRKRVIHLSDSEHNFKDEKWEMWACILLCLHTFFGAWTTLAFSAGRWGKKIIWFGPVRRGNKWRNKNIKIQPHRDSNSTSRDTVQIIYPQSTLTEFVGLDLVPTFHFAGNVQTLCLKMIVYHSTMSCLCDLKVNCGLKAQ